MAKRRVKSKSGRINAVSPHRDKPKRISATTANRELTMGANQKTARLAPGDVFWPDRLDHVKGIAMRGLNDYEMAEMMGISPELMSSWKAYYPTFNRAIEEGRSVADAEVVAALHKNAIGFEYETDEVVRTRRGGQVLTVKKRSLPDTQAQKFWLSNRSPHWRGDQTHTVSTPKGGHIAVKDETKVDVINSILNMISPQPDR